MNDTFYVCFYKAKDGSRIGHGVSPSLDFPEKPPKIIEHEDSKSKEPKFHTIFKMFCESMNGYMDMLPLLAAFGAIVTQNIRESELIRFCDENSISKTEKNTKDIFEIPISKVGDFNSIDLRHRGGQLVSKQIPKMLLMGVVSSLDHHMAQLMREVIRRKPDILSSTEKNVSAKDVLLAESIEEFKQILVEREVDAATRESFEDQVEWFERKIPLKDSIRSQYDIWDELIEIIERRNLFAHANGIVNSRYLRKISKGEYSKKISVGQELYASRKYFTSSLETICEFGIKICQVVWRKIEPDDSKEAEISLGDFGYNLIERGEYKLASRILEFALSLRGKTDEGRRRMNIVHLANSYKLMGSAEKANKILEREDWDIVSDEFAISVAAVRGDVDRVKHYMERMAHAGDWTGGEFEQWPVFYHVREDPEFVRAFERIYKRKYAPAPKNRNRILENFYKASRNGGAISSNEQSNKAGEVNVKKLAPPKKPRKLVPRARNQATKTGAS